MYVPCIRHIPSHCTCRHWCQHPNSMPLASMTPTPMPLLYVTCLALWSITTMAPLSHVHRLNIFLHCPFLSWMPSLTLTPTSPSILIVLCWFYSSKSQAQGVVDSALWLRIKSAVRYEKWCLLKRPLATSPFNFVCCNSTIVMKIGTSWEGTDVRVKLVGCRTGLWVVLLQALFYPKMPWYYVKKSFLYFILHTHNTPTFYSNVWDVTVGVFMLLVPIHGAGTW